MVGGWGTHIPVVEVPAAVLEWGLGAGETAVLGSRSNTRRLYSGTGRCRRSQARPTPGIPVKGTLGVVRWAKHQGQIASAARIMQDLRAAGLHLNDTRITNVLQRSAGETWPI